MKKQLLLCALLLTISTSAFASEDEKKETEDSAMEDQSLKKVATSEQWNPSWGFGKPGTKCDWSLGRVPIDYQDEDKKGSDKKNEKTLLGKVREKRPTGSRKKKRPASEDKENQKPINDMDEQEDLELNLMNDMEDVD